MENIDRSELIETIIKNTLNSSLRGWSAVAGTLNEVMGDYRTGSGVAIQFSDGSQYKITIERIK